MAIRTSSKMTPDKSHVGERVDFSYVLRDVTGTVTEDRGPIGRGGRHLYQVTAAQELSDPIVIELPEEELRFVLVRFVFQASAGDQIELSVQQFVNDKAIRAIVVPENDPRLEPWHPGKPISWYSPEEVLVVSPKSATSKIRLPKNAVSGLWIVGVAATKGTKMDAVLQDNKGAKHAPIDIRHL